MQLPLEELAAFLGDKIASTPQVGFGVSVDSRSIEPGQIFVALKAKRDGHNFVDEAMSLGACAYVGEKEVSSASPGIIVANSYQALMDIGRFARNRTQAHVVAITGSVGKTTIKDLVAEVLSTSLTTAYAKDSYNNEIGVPLTLANAADDALAIVCEMGARGKGHITTLCEISRPAIGVVSRVGLAHSEFFHDLDGVAQAKGELIEALDATGTAILNADDDLVLGMRARTKARVITYGLGSSADVTAVDIGFDDLARAHFTLKTPSGSCEVRLFLHGIHQASNALAAACVGEALGVTTASIAKGLAATLPATSRMQILRTETGSLLVNDAYNANPTSMKAALEALAHLPASHRIAVLGYMEELGDDADHQHRLIADFAKALGVFVIAYDTPSYGVISVNSLVDLQAQLAPFEGHVAILVKASRAAHLDLLAQELLGLI